MFVLDRIKMLQVTDERFTIPKDFNLDDFMRHSFKAMPDELYTVRIRISPGWPEAVKKLIRFFSASFRRKPESVRLGAGAI